jgi:hypothetical protein
MTVIVRDVMGQRSEGEGEFIGVLRLPDQRQHEIAAAKIVHQIAEQLASEWIVTHVLDDGPAIGIGVGFTELIGRETAIACA